MFKFLICGHSSTVMEDKNNEIKKIGRFEVSVDEESESEEEQKDVWFLPKKFDRKKYYKNRTFEDPSKFEGTDHYYWLDNGHKVTRIKHLMDISYYRIRPMKSHRLNEYLLLRNKENKESKYEKCGYHRNVFKSRSFYRKNEKKEMLRKLDNDEQFMLEFDENGIIIIDDLE